MSKVDTKETAISGENADLANALLAAYHLDRFDFDDVDNMFAETITLNPKKVSQAWKQLSLDTTMARLNVFPLLAGLALFSFAEESK